MVAYCRPGTLTAPREYMPPAPAHLSIVQEEAPATTRRRRLSRIGVRSMAVAACLLTAALPHEISHYICLTACSLEFLGWVWSRT